MLRTYRSQILQRGTITSYQQMLAVIERVAGGSIEIGTRSSTSFFASFEERDISEAAFHQRNGRR